MSQSNANGINNKHFISMNHFMLWQFGKITTHIPYKKERYTKSEKEFKEATNIGEI